MIQPVKQSDEDSHSQRVAQGFRRVLKSASVWAMYILIAVVAFVVVAVIMNVAQDLWVNR